MLKCLFVLGLCFLLIAPAWGKLEMTDGWAVTSNGKASSSGLSQVTSSVSGDPSITLGVLSSSSLDGPGSVELERTGSISDDLSLGGFDLSVSFDGDVKSETILTSEGTAAAAAYVGATATGQATGADTYEISGTSDVTTSGYLQGEGSSTATASGTSSYGASVESSTAEVWGQVDGTSSTSLAGSSTDSYASTSDMENGIHAESSVLLNQRGGISDSASTAISAYASVLNSATADISVSGQALSGAWDSSTTETKTRLSNENVASSAEGTLTGTARAPGSGDASDVSAVVESTATRNSVVYSGLQTGLYVSGGSSSYASAIKSSDSEETYSQALIADALWGSVARQTSQIAIEYGSAETVGSGAIVKEAGGSAISFAKIFMTTDLLESGGVTSTSGNMTLDTYTEVSGSESAVAGAIVNGAGNGDMSTSDGYMYNDAGYTGGLDHYSYVSSEEIKGVIANIATNAWVTVDPAGSAGLSKPHQIDTTSDPMYAWASTEGWYYQAH